MRLSPPQSRLNGTPEIFTAATRSGHTTEVVIGHDEVGFPDYRVYLDKMQVGAYGNRKEALRVAAVVLEVLAILEQKR